MTITTFIWNNQTFEVKMLSENAVLVQSTKGIALESLHHLAKAIETASENEVEDVIVSYENIVVAFTHLINSKNSIHDFFKKITFKMTLRDTKQKHYIKVDFQKGLDWKTLEEVTQLSQNQIIDIFTAPIYTVAMLGFIPGFIYLKGLDGRLACPRKSIPRKQIPKGSIGIGGEQAGIYGLSSPGGWQIIGQTEMNTFDTNAFPPTILNPLDEVVFYQ